MTIEKWSMDLARKKEREARARRRLREEKARLKRIETKREVLQAEIKTEEAKPPKYTRPWTEDRAWMILYKGVKFTKNKLLMEALVFLREVYLKKDLAIARGRKEKTNGEQ